MQNLTPPPPPPRSPPALCLEELHRCRGPSPHSPPLPPPPLPPTPFNPAAPPPLSLRNPLSSFPVLGPARLRAQAFTITKRPSVTISNSSDHYTTEVCGRLLVDAAGSPSTTPCFFGVRNPGRAACEDALPLGMRTYKPKSKVPNNCPGKACKAGPRGRLSDS